MTKRPIYLDYQATTPTDPRVVEAMTPYFNERFGNPHSVHHAYGRAAAEAVEAARAEVAALINAEAREIVFTSGATEANNLAIKGVARFHRQHFIAALKRIAAKRPNSVLVMPSRAILRSIRARSMACGWSSMRSRRIILTRSSCTSEKSIASP